MPTLADVAAKAGVSKSTASRVLNGLAVEFRISKPTVSLVEAAAKALGYRPNYAAKALTSGRTRCIGMIGRLLMDNPWGQAYYAPIMAGISEQVRSSGFTLLFTHHNWHDMGLDATTTRQVEALISPGFAMSPNYTQLDLEALPAPMVLIDEPPVPSHHPVVRHDATEGLAAAVDHLVALGHRRIGWIGFAQIDADGNTRAGSGLDHERRRAAVARRLDHHGLALVADHRIQQREELSTDRARQLERLAKDLLWERERLADATALVCYNDLVAVAAVRALRATGRAVPDEVSVIGVDNLWSDLLDPALTTVDMRLFDLGQRVGEIAIDIAEHPRRRQRWRDHQEHGHSELVVRGSSGPTPG